LFFSLEYKKTLEADVKSDTSGCFERLLIALCKGTRDENPVVNPTAVASDVEALYKAGNVFCQNVTQ
jgi:annexin A7/11